MGPGVEGSRTRRSDVSGRAGQGDAARRADLNRGTAGEGERASVALEITVDGASFSVPLTSIGFAAPASPVSVTVALLP